MRPFTVSSRSLALSLVLILACIVPRWAGAASANPAVPQAYSVTDLGTFGGAFSTAAGINAAGHVVGEAATAAGDGHPFLWREGELIDLGTLGGANGNAVDVNAADQVVGAAETAAGETRAFLWEAGEMTDLGTLGGAHSSAIRINDAGQVVGLSTTGPGQELGDPGSHAFLWDAGTMTDLGTLGGAVSRANGINEAGQIVGAAQNEAGELRPFLWRDGTMTDLGTLPDYTAGRAIRVNATGQIVGWSETAGGAVTGSASAVSRRAFLWSDGSLRDLGLRPGFEISRAYGLNDAGHVVGILEHAEEPEAATPEAVPENHAFRWVDGALTDLNDLLSATGGMELLSANGINDAGQIVGTGQVAGEDRAFLLTPAE